MRLSLPTSVLIAVLCWAPRGATSDQRAPSFLEFPARDVRALGQIDKLVVTVTCSWISDLRDVPELYDIEMGYTIPTENVLEARPRLGAAAVELSKWNGVFGIRTPSDPDTRSCFTVTVRAEGRSGTERHWTGEQLGLKR